MKILLATDGTPSSDRAIARLAELAPPGTHEVLLVHVRTRQAEPVLVALDGAVALAPADTERDMEAHLAYACTQLARQNLAARALLVSGADPATRILEVAAAEGAEMIVVGTRHLGGLGRFLLGSISNKVASHSTVPLLIVP
jgi:nucleotide-binding universal stress UspA family protein